MPAVETQTRSGFQDNLREGWVALLLLALILFSLTGSVMSANWTDGLWVLTWAALAGLIIGWMLARVRARSWLAHPAMLVVGIFVVAYLNSLLVPFQVPWNEKLVVIETRLGDWIYRIATGGLGTDAFIFVMYTCALAYLIGYLSAWFVFRRDQPWGAILPTGLGMMINLFYAPPQNSVYLVIYLLAVLLLLVRTTFIARQREWRRAAIGYASDIGLDFLTYGLAFSALIVLATWIVPPEMPNAQWFNGITDVVNRPWTDFAESFTRMFSTLRGGSRLGPTTFYGQSLALGGPVRLGDQPVLDIQSSAGRYWRATVYDHYVGVGWTTSATELKHINADDAPLAAIPMNERLEITQTITVLFPDGDLLIAAAQPERVNIPIDARYLALNAGAQQYADFTILRADHRLQAGAQYQVMSSISDADEETLRASGTDYPIWIRDRYLQLPNTLPPRVRDLAEQITRHATNPYDKARALEAWLRANIVYDDNVSPPPPDRDGVDYTLFDRRAGYCNYYASAMAVMARTLGIPARIASGYALGQFDNGTYHVKESDAHTWVEVYFNGLGWVEFEPTASKPVIQRLAVPSKPAPATDTGDSAQPDDSALNGRNRRTRFIEDDGVGGTGTGFNRGFQLPVDTPTAVIGGSALGLLLLVGLGVVAAQTMWVLNVRKLPPASRAYAEMFRFARWLGLKMNRAQTPNEQANELKTRLPDTQADIARVSSLYVREQYSAQDLEPAEKQEIQDLTRRVNGRINRAILARYFQLASARVRGVFEGLLFALHLRR